MESKLTVFCAAGTCCCPNTCPQVGRVYVGPQATGIQARASCPGAAGGGCIYYQGKCCCNPSPSPPPPATGARFHFLPKPGELYNQNSKAPAAKPNVSPIAIHGLQHAAQEFPWLRKSLHDARNEALKSLTSILRAGLASILSHTALVCAMRFFVYASSPQK